MGYLIPIINLDTSDVKEAVKLKLSEEKTQKRIVLVIVCIVLLLDNMLYMVIVPIVPHYLRSIDAWPKIWAPTNETLRNGTFVMYQMGTITHYKGENQALGWLFAIKAIVQLLVNPFSGTLIDRRGYELPMTIGLIIMFLSTSVFALGRSYAVLFIARSMQGVGSAFADTSGLAMIADRFTEENERSKAMGIALAFISFGSLVAPPFGSVLYDLAGKGVPFMLLAMVCLIDGVLVFLVIKPKTQRTDTGERVKGTPIHHLFMDPFIAICAGALVTANVSLAFLEPTIGKHMMDHMTDEVKGAEWKIGVIWLPAFLPHVAGVYVTVVMVKKHPHWPWLLAAIGLAMEGLSCLFIPVIKNYWVMMLPLSSLCFGIALVDTALLPLLGYLVDTRHVSVYGSVYAIADISYSMAYAIGPIVAGGIMDTFGFFALNIIICLSNVLYAPVLRILKRIYTYKPFEANEMGGYNQFQAADGGDTGAVGGFKGYGALDGDNGMMLAMNEGAVNGPKAPLVDYGYDYPQESKSEKITYPPLPTNLGSKYQQQ